MTATESMTITVYWTTADAAELDVLVHDLVDTIAVHHDRCAECAQGLGWCGPLREAAEQVIAWRDWRILQTRARTLRVEQLAHEWLDRVKAGNRFLEREAA
jgi:hypothetical protein